MVEAIVAVAIAATAAPTAITLVRNRLVETREQRGRLETIEKLDQLLKQALAEARQTPGQFEGREGAVRWQVRIEEAATPKATYLRWRLMAASVTIWPEKASTPAATGSVQYLAVAP